MPWLHFCAVLCGGLLDDVERAHVDAAAHAALRDAAASGHTALLGDCLKQLASSAPRVATVLHRFCSGPLGELFNRPTSVRLGARVIGISLRDLRDELVPAATLIVAEWLWALVRRNPEPRHIVVDEVGLLCAHPPLRTLLAQLARRCRKYSASLVVATQNAGDLLATEEGRVMATNAAIVLLGGQRGADTALMQSALLAHRRAAGLPGGSGTGRVSPARRPATHADAGRSPRRAARFDHRAMSRQQHPAVMSLSRSYALDSMMYNDTMRRTTIMAGEDLLDQLQAIARDEGKPLAEVIREALRQRARTPQPPLQSVGTGRSREGIGPVDWDADTAFAPPPWR